MITILITMVVLGFFFGKFIFKEFRDLGYFIDYFFAGTLFLLMGGLISVLLYILIGSFVPQGYVLDSTSEIIAFEDNLVTNGSFFLGIGSIDENAYYYYYEKNGDGMNMKRLRVWKATLFYDDEPRIEKYSMKADGNWSLFGLVLPETKYSIYVPEGTISGNFNSDLQ